MDSVTKWRRKKGLCQIALALPEDMRAQFKRAAQKSGCSMNAILVKFIADYIEESK